MSLASEVSKPAASVPDAAIGPRIYGVVDVVRANRVAGWAIDRSDSAAAVDVEIRREGRLVATVRADRYRRDLDRGGVGTGRYGFACELAPALDPGLEFTLTATARTADGASCELKRSGLDEGAVTAERRLMERIFEAVSRPADPDLASVAAAVARIELVQARIEAALAAVEPPPTPAPTGLRITAGVALAVGIVSLGIGLASMWLY